MKWFVATIGALIVWFGATMALLLIPVVIYPALYESISGLVFSWVVATPLGILAGVLSFRATLRQYAKADRNAKVS